jgi:hypothetical protein
MRATPIILLVASLAGTAFGASAKFYSDGNWYAPSKHLNTTQASDNSDGWATSPRPTPPPHLSLSPALAPSKHLTD